MINDLKQFEKLLKLCRRQGVLKLKALDIELEFGDLPVEAATKGDYAQEESPYSNFPTGELTPEQLIFYSAGGDPKDDPALKREAV